MGAVAIALVEVSDRNLHGFAHFPEHPGAHAVGATLILLDLLKADAEGVGQGGLAHPQLVPATTNAETDMDVDGMGRWGVFTSHDALLA